MSGERSETDDSSNPRIARSSVFWFAAYVGAVVLPIYQLVAIMAWGSPDFFEPQSLALGLLILAIGGAIYGVLAATALFMFRWFFRLDRRP